MVDVQKVAKRFFKKNIWLINVIRNNLIENSCCFVDFKHIYASKRVIFKILGLLCVKTLHWMQADQLK